MTLPIICLIACRANARISSTEKCCRSDRCGSLSRARNSPRSACVSRPPLGRFTARVEHVATLVDKQVVEVQDPVIVSDDLVLYDTGKGGWLGYYDHGTTDTNPGSIYAGYSDANNNQISWGYLDDECDGIVTVTLNRKNGTPLCAHGCGLVPDRRPSRPSTLRLRVISDELEEFPLGPDVEGDVPIDEAKKSCAVVLETVRLMNTAVMNGNAINGQLNVASTMVRQDTNDFGRYFEPIMSPDLVDNLAVCALHERVFNGLATGAAPWFAAALRLPEEIGDLSSGGRAEMPALMRNADGNCASRSRGGRSERSSTPRRVPFSTTGLVPTN